MNQNMTPPPPPSFRPNPPHKKNKTWVWIVAAAVVVLYIIIASQFFPTNQEINIERLRDDSIALQADFRPIGQYDYYQDIDKAVSDLRNLGDPLRFSADSIDIFGTPQTAVIANYNIAKCDTVLNEVLPMWRRQLAFTLQKQLNTEAQTVVRMSQQHENSTGIEIYSLRYLSKENIEKDRLKYNSVFRNLGFKSAAYAPSPDSEGLEYTFD